MNDLSIDPLGRGSLTGRDWTACTTGAVFLVKPQDHDLIAELTSYASENRTTAGLDPRLAIKERYVNCAGVETSSKGAWYRTAGVACACARQQPDAVTIPKE